MVANLYVLWARMYLGREVDGADEDFLPNWDEAEHVACKTIAFAKVTRRRLKGADEKFLSSHEITLGRIFYHQQKYADATQVVTDAFARLKSRKEWKKTFGRVC